MSVQVKSSIKRFYLTKQYKGRIISRKVAKELFRNQTFLYCDYVRGGQINTLIVCDIALITKEDLDKFPKTKKKLFSFQCLRGTNLIPLDAKKFSWWQFKEFGSGFLFSDIEACHINKQIKNRDRVISYLELIKNLYKNKNGQTQLKLPGF